MVRYADSAINRYLSISMYSLCCIGTGLLVGHAVFGVNCLFLLL